jgi:hypothetical protein
MKKIRKKTDPNCEMKMNLKKKKKMMKKKRRRKKRKRDIDR